MLTMINNKPNKIWKSILILNHYFFFCLLYFIDSCLIFLAAMVIIGSLSYL